MQGLIDLRMSQVSSRRAPVDEVLGVQRLYSAQYSGWNVKHFHTWYAREHQGIRSYSWVKNVLQEAKLVVRSKAARQAAQETRAQAPGGDDGAPGREHPSGGCPSRSGIWW
jgi:hypothetical protein